MMDGAAGVRRMVFSTDSEPAPRVSWIFMRRVVPSRGIGSLPG